MLALGLLCVAAVTQASVVIMGSDTLGAKLMPRLAETFRQQRPDIVLEITSEGSSTGISALLAGQTDIAMSSRSLKGSERAAADASGMALEMIPIAYDGIAMIVHNTNVLEALSKRDVTQIFTGVIEDWSALKGPPGRISVYTRNPSSGTYASFRSLAMGNRDYCPSSLRMAGNEQIVAEVADNPHGMGYVGLAYLHHPMIKILKVGGVGPDPDSIRAQRYPYARPLFLAVDRRHLSVDAEAFLDFVLSPAGQAVVAEVDFVPLLDPNAATPEAVTSSLGGAPR